MAVNFAGFTLLPGIARHDSVFSDISWILIADADSTVVSVCTISAGIVVDIEEDDIQ
ncbi:hypothetical protein OIDMADRAFT_17857 [Oidiodendron maius Zn]|uniref:Uncharacterized protein n=1 Tax=Oidiodendron maius (strain Zn) TaxID=913774 RepID=A0A0C3HAA9_OIDMZ|nr:hypothetical protein OIDMADRAFT_17857 [Oidiodendron maius Zn]